MAILSKEKYRLIKHLDCHVLHPWTSSCSHNSLLLFWKSFKGSARFFSVIYLLQILARKHYQHKHELVQVLTNFCRTCAFGSFQGGFSVLMMCFFRWILGKYTIATLGFIPGTLAGMGIFFEDNSRREIDITLALAMVISLYVRVLEDEGILKMTLTKELILFTTCSSALLYCLRAFKNSYTVLWPFTPPKLSDNPEKIKTCAHKGSCLDHIKKTTTTFLCYGSALQCFKVFAINISKIFTKPGSILKAFFKPDNLRLPLFAGLYVLLFKGISCSLVHLRGQDEAWHALPAGTVASLCYLIQPNIALMSIALSNVSQILCKNLRIRVKLPQWSYREMVYMLCIGMLFHARAEYPHCCPRYLYTIMDTITEGGAEAIYGLVDKNLLIRF